MRQRLHGCVLLAAAFGSACLLQDVVLTSDRNDGDPPVQICANRERLDPATHACVPCDYLTPHPTLVCTCGYQWVEDPPLPWCDDGEAFYDCDPCATIDDCESFRRDTDYGGIGTSQDCGMLIACCDKLAAGPSPCCLSNTYLRCAFDGGNPEVDPHVVSCEPEPCCLGALCQEDLDCRGYPEWQTCDLTSGRCIPACREGVEYCCVACGCTCDLDQNPP